MSSIREETSCREEVSKVTDLDHCYLYHAQKTAYGENCYQRDQQPLEGYGFPLTEAKSLGFHTHPSTSPGLAKSLHSRI